MQLAYSSDDEDFTQYESKYDSSELEQHNTSHARTVATKFKSRNAIRQAKTTFFEKSTTLQKQRSNLERDIHNSFFSTKNPELRHAAAQASTESREMNATFQKESHKLATQLIEFKNKTDRLRKQLQRLVHDQTTEDQGTHHANALRPEEVDSLHSTFDHLESELALFKREGRSRYQELQRKERTLIEELDTFQERSKRWDTTTSDILREAARYSTPSKSAANRTNASSVSGRANSNKRTSSRRPTARPIEIINIERQIEETGGTNGGWDSRDHATFLRLLSRYSLRTDAPSSTSISTSPSISFSSKTSNNSKARSSAASPGTAPDMNTDLNRKRKVISMLKYAGTKLMHISDTDIKQHWVWYTKYTSLITKKRNAVQQWREKRAQSSSGPSSATTPPSSPSSTSASFTTPEQRRSARALKNQATSERLRKESDQKKQQLNEWKETRENEKRVAQEKEKNRLNEMKRNRRRANEDREIQKEEIAMYRLQREAEAAHQKAVQKVLATARGHVRGPPTSSETIRQRHARDMKKIMIRKEKKELALHAKQEKERKRLDITRNVNKKATKDFARLTRHTTASAHNALTPEELDDLETKRKTTHGGHNANLFGHTGAELSRGKTYAMSKASSLKVPSWRKIARRSTSK